MKNEHDEDHQCYTVVKNQEDQFSIWFEEREIPLGWFAVGKTGSKSECLTFIKTAWIDMRPASLRVQMNKQANTIDKLEPTISL